MDKVFINIKKKGGKFKLKNNTLLGKLADLIIYFLLGVFAFCAVYPFLYVAIRSIIPADQLALSSNLFLIPKSISLEAYKFIFSSDSILITFLNSAYITITSVIFNVAITAMTAFVLSRRNLLGKKIIMMYVIITMYFSGGIIPYYLTIKDLGLVDKLSVMILPCFINTFFLIVMKTSFQDIPYELEESATIDGAGYFRVFISIILPLSKPVLATAALMVGVAQWNNWFTPMLFISNRDKWPLSLLLRDILIMNNTTSAFQSGYVSNTRLLSESIKMAVVVISIAPILFIYPWLQKYFVKGMTIGAVKG